jgi:hypothetical protein
VLIFFQNICIGLVVIFALQLLKPVKMEFKGFLGVVFLIMFLWGLGAVSKEIFNLISAP